MKKLWKTLFAALLVLPLFTGVLGAKAVTAAKATTTNVTINKRIWKDVEAPAQKVPYKILGKKWTLVEIHLKEPALQPMM